MTPPPPPPVKTAILGGGSGVGLGWVKAQMRPHWQATQPPATEAHFYRRRVLFQRAERYNRGLNQAPVRRGPCHGERQCGDECVARKASLQAVHRPAPTPSNSDSGCPAAEGAGPKGHPRHRTRGRWVHTWHQRSFELTHPKIETDTSGRTPKPRRMQTDGRTQPMCRCSTLCPHIFC